MSTKETTSPEEFADEDAFHGKPFDDYQKELMIGEIGDILVLLRNNRVISYDKDNPIELLNSRKNQILFEKTTEQEVERFTSLVYASRHQLSYLVSNMTTISERIEVERKDRIMGCVSYASTYRLRRRYNAPTGIVTWELKSRRDTPENLILALVIFSISIFSKRFSNPYNGDGNFSELPSTLRDRLGVVNSFAEDLLRSKSLKDVLEHAIEERHAVPSLFQQMMIRIDRGIIPLYYSRVYQVLLKWRFWIYTMDVSDRIRQSLRYHFWYPASGRPSDLYESWVCYSLLRLFIETFDLRLKFARRPEMRFQSEDKSIDLVYQKQFGTQMYYNNDEIIDEPDITVEFNHRPVLIFDAKHTTHRRLSYREKMQSYLKSSTSRYAVVVHSNAPKELWDCAEGKDGTKIYWTHLIPPHKIGEERRWNDTIKSNIQRLATEALL